MLIKLENDRLPVTCETEPTGACSVYAVCFSKAHQTPSCGPSTVQRWGRLIAEVLDLDRREQY
jgi:hypothetical protein